jgi:probable F420-dependent oxidoreductase
MKYGVYIFLTDDGIAVDELARLVEERGFESLFLAEHTHIPANGEARFLSEGEEFSERYWRTLDPFLALTAAAAATERLLLGTGICLVVQRDPITTAKEVATLDWLSNGRFLFGVGGGWNLEEMRNHGTDPARRFALMRERIEAMKQIWTQPEASFNGRYVAFEPIWSYPKPVQQPHPPILVGGIGPRVIDRVLAYGDEWLPEPSDRLYERMAELQERARAVGREQGVPITIYGAVPEDVDAYRRAGAHRCVFSLPAGDEAATKRRLDELARAVVAA